MSHTGVAPEQWLSALHWLHADGAAPPYMHAHVPALCKISMPSPPAAL